jgi:hypothetical protein
MKLKNTILLGLAHFIVITIYVMFGFSRNFFLNILFLILLLNISSFIIITPIYKKNFQFIMVFSAFSLISLIVYVFLFSLFYSILKYFQLNLMRMELNKIYLFAIEAEKSYNSISGFLKIIFSYLIFAILPSFIILSVNSKTKKKKLLKKNNHKK